MAGAWSEDEVEHTIDTYFAMLGLELAHEDYVKREFIRALAQQVDRSRGSLEFKFQNISAVLDDLGAAWIPGYKPRSNVQQLLRDRVRERYDADVDLRRDMIRAADASADIDVHVPLGEIQIAPSTPVGHRSRARFGRHIDYAAREAANRSLGLAGELAIVDFERRTLRAAGRDDLAAQVRHVSVEDGDGLGYDIASFDPGTEAPRYIEVKTTRLAKELPFHVTRNEVDFSAEVGEAYCLARVYQFGPPSRTRVPEHFRLTGPLADTLWLDPASYVAGPR
ncbi:DUF3883 domain-containing protein [Granulicoccus phenolivorans]|uniref:DUF3883 domain-containing protein n=1 Tax=Granulicoccus phenolivorans TaxID=266854 RepID=UPI0004221C79|nr:DUF3883 domain-containing protein [Granulicoccus phenolivorans]